MIYAYIRVSTDRQDCANQRMGIDELANAMKLTIDKYIEDDGISGTKEPEERALGGLLRKLQPGDIIICSELSRLGRKLFMIMRVLECIMKSGAKLYSVKDNYELGDNIQSKVLAFAFGLSAEIERTLISQRTKESLCRLKAQGKHLGRPYGRTSATHKLDGQQECVQTMLNQRIPKVQLAKRLKVSVPTLNKFIKTNNL